MAKTRARALGITEPTDVQILEPDGSSGPLPANTTSINVLGFVKPRDSDVTLTATIFNPNPGQTQWALQEFTVTASANAWQQTVDHFAPGNRILFVASVDDADLGTTVDDFVNVTIAMVAKPKKKPKHGKHLAKHKGRR